MATSLETLTIPRFCHQCAGRLEERLVQGEERPRLVCSRCGFIHYVNPKVVVGAIPERGGRILLMRRGIEPRYGAWTFPGGFMEVDETAEEAALREAEEEVGLSLKLGRLVGVYSRPATPTPDAGPGILVLVFRARAGRTPPKPGNECLTIAWFQPEEIPWEELAFDTTRWALRDWVALRKGRGPRVSDKPKRAARPSTGSG